MNIKRSKKFIVGLTGGIACGKTTVSNIFQQLGIDIVDADIIAREIVQPGSKALAEIHKRFGDNILLSDSTLDRKKLKTIIFNNEEDKQWLEQLLHPLIRTTIFQQVEHCKSQYVIIVAPLLLEGNLWQEVNRILVISIPKQLQIDRVMARDNIDSSTAESIIDSQLSETERLAKADDIIENTKGLNYLEQQVLNLHTIYQKEAQNDGR